MAQAQLKAIVTAEDRASGPISRLSDSLDKLGQTLERTNNKVTEGSVSNKKLATAVFTGEAAYRAFSATLQRATQFLGSSITSANNYQAAMIGLATVSRAFGQDAEKATKAAKELASDGLMSVNEAGTGLKNLLATGFGLNESITLMTQFKDIAAFNRQGTLAFGEAIVGATIGIKNGNSILVDNIGLTKNLSIILKEAGYSEQDLMRATSDTNVRMALYKGLLKETAAFTGDASRLTNTFAGAQSRARVATEYLKISMGQLLQNVGTPLINAYTKFISGNTETVASMALAGAGVLVFGTVLLGLVKVMQTVSVAAQMLNMSTGPLALLFLALSAIVGVGLYNSFNKMQKNIAEQNKGLTGNADAAKQAQRGAEGLGSAQEKLGEKIAKVNQQIELENRSYMESLAKMIQSHQEKVKTIEDQISEENSSFKDAQDTAVADHQERVDRIQEQITAETNLGVMANQKKLSDLQSQLAKENAEYDKKQADDLARHEKRMAQMQKELDDETALLQKHADDVNAVRDVQLLDEIEALKRSHTEQLAALEQQKADIIANAGATAAGVVGAFAGQQGTAQDTGEALGSAMASGMKQAMIEGFSEVGVSILKFFYRIGDFIRRIWNSGIWKLLGASKFWEDPGASISKSWSEAGQSANDDFNTWQGRAIGGNVQAGTPYMVGEQGRELFVPDTNGKIIPNSGLGGEGGGNINITIQATAFAGSQMEARKFAQMIQDALMDAKAIKGMA